MFKMVEVVGSSSVSFSDAVKTAVEELIKSGEDIHFFEVVEQRGSVRDSKFKEFQVKIKAGIQIKPTSQNGTCQTCNKTVKGHGHLCSPKELEKEEKCEWCGNVIMDERHMCSDKIKDISYICNTCGRTAIKAQHLCEPKKIK